jgi:acetyl esterase/lipase
VVAFSAGTYTLPYPDKDIDGDGLPDMIVLPYGTADLNKRLGHPINPIRLRQVRFFIGVGGADNSAADVPHQWDPYEGRTRLERAREFAAALQSEGVRCTLQVFPGVGHEVTVAMLNQAVQFLTSGDSQLN